MTFHDSPQNCGWCRTSSSPAAPLQPLRSCGPLRAHGKLLKAPLTTEPTGGQGGAALRAPPR